MFLKMTKSFKSRTNLAIVRGYRDIDGKTKHEIIESLGYLDELEKIYPDPISHFKKRAKELTDERLETGYAYGSEKEAIKDGSNTLNAGYLVLQNLLNKLNIKPVLRGLLKTTEMKCNLNDIFEFLVYSQVLFPGSKLSSYNKRYHFFENYDFSEDQMYRAIQLIGESFEPLKDYISRAVNETFKYDTTNTFFDGTNFYFEIDREDDFRRKGPSKEGKTSPIISAGLLIDANHIPIDISVYPGNESEKPNFLELIREIKQKNKIQGRTVIVADKGLNYGDSISTIIKNGFGYIFSKSIPMSDLDTKNAILNQNGYLDVIDDDGNLEFKYKSYIHNKVKIMVTNELGEKTEKYTQQHVVIKWSKASADKAKYERERQIDKARRIIKNPTLYDKAKVGAVASYIKRLSFDDKDGVIIEKSELKLDLNRIKKEEQFDGYYMIVTSELKMKPLDILRKYREQYNIEHLFRVTKTFLKLRPIYLQKKERIKAHVLISFMALILLKILDVKILQKKFTIDSIIKSIREFNFTKIGKNKCFLPQYNQIMNVLGEKAGSRANVEIRSIEEIKKLFKNLKA